MRKTVIAVLVSIILAVGLPSWAQSPKGPEAFYKGARVYVPTGAPPPSGAGVFIRIYQQYFEEATGAKLVVDFKKGGGGIEGLNVAFTAKPDGLTMGSHMGEVLASNWLLDIPAVTYDLTKVIPIGASMGSPVGMYVKTGGPYDSLEKLKAGKNLVAAGASPAGLISVWPTIGAHLLGLDFKLVTGFRGPPGCKLAVMQEEAHFTGVGIHTPGFMPDLKPLALLSLKRHEILPDLPTLPELMKMTEKGKTMLRLRDKLTPLGPSFYLPSGVPKDRVKYLRDVFNKIAVRPDFISEVKKKVRVYGLLRADEYDNALKYLIKHKVDFEEIIKLVKQYTK
jgi:tripartite-type tricarboxylate transporter receptor subunit TctC